MLRSWFKNCKAKTPLRAHCLHPFSPFPEQEDITLELKYDIARQFYIRIRTSDLDLSQPLPEVFINIYHNTRGKVKYLECQTLPLVKLNQKLKDIHNEIVAMSDTSIQSLIAEVRTRLHPLFKVSESIALLDLLTSFANLVTSTPTPYCQPEISPGTLAIHLGRHPIAEKLHSQTRRKYVPNDVYATQDYKRFQIITGCNMSGKSMYIRSIALITIMAQIGCFVPAEYASFPIIHQLFARVSTDDCLEANISTFASEMREIACILRNIEPRCLVIVDELGRGTSTTDGLAIAIAIAEALVQSKAYVWFVTHFRDLSRILAERVGVYNLHMRVDIEADFSRMKMKYRVSEGREEQKFYGLALAQLVELPEQIMETAVQVSKALNTRNDAKRSDAKLIALAKKRKLAVHMKETLIQAHNGPLEGKELLDKLKVLQEQFTVRMTAIDAELEAADDQQRQDQGGLIENQLQATPELETSKAGTSSERTNRRFASLSPPMKRRIGISEVESAVRNTSIPTDPFQPMPTEIENESQAFAGETLVFEHIPMPTKQESQSDWLMLHGGTAKEPIVIEDDTEGVGESWREDED